MSVRTLFKLGLWLMVVWLVLIVVSANAEEVRPPLVLKPAVEPEKVIVESIEKPEAPPELEDGQYERYGAFEWFKSAPNALFLYSGIYSGLEIEFELALWRHPEIDTVVLSSQGGHVLAALSIADYIHRHGLNTYIPAESECASACGFIFMSGKSRIAEGKLGAHNVSTNPGVMRDANEAYTHLQKLIGFMMLRMKEYDTPQEYFVNMLLTHYQGMHFFQDTVVDAWERGTLFVSAIDRMHFIRNKYVEEYIKWEKSQK